MLRCPSTSEATGSGEAVKKRRVEPSEILGMKVVEDLPVMDDNLKEVEEKSRLAALHGEEEMRKMAVRLMKGICLRVEEVRAELKRKKIEFKRNVARLKTDLVKEGKGIEALKALQVVEINNLYAKARINLKEVVAERDRLGRHLVSKGYSEHEVDAIKADTYVEEAEDEKIEHITISVADGLDGVSSQTELKDIRLRIKYLEAELAKERKASVELQSTRLCEDGACHCNQEFAEEFDRMREANKDREDQHIKVYFNFVEATQTTVDLALKNEEKEAEIEKGNTDLLILFSFTSYLLHRFSSLNPEFSFDARTLKLHSVFD
ncbi:hypothetical protein GIB67_002679 [Kingdonia uniflora]|uniref:Uncharacterized protein n=1 Tax=Kingdonia uniflora TaxID=39325 RepID=A0A7J7LJG4_9MAGN|nr:hypothetical protein GIB67_002679 [Kingdonia uniflora]